MTRERKTKVPCPVCRLHLHHCVCEFIPRLDLKTRICLVVHSRELKRTTNTGRLAVQALVNSEMRIRGRIQDAGGMLDLSDLLRGPYRTFLFYPSDDAVELTEDLVRADPGPIQLIVPDGNWRQAGKVHYRHRELAHVPRVKISAPNDEKYFIRSEHKTEGMATLHAVAEALGIIEGREVKERLMKLYHAKLEKTLLARGVKLDSE